MPWKGTHTSPTWTWVRQRSRKIMRDQCHGEAKSLMKWSSDIKWLGICLKDVYNWSFEVFWWMYNGQIFRIFCIPRRLEFSGRWRSCWKPRGLSKQSQHVYNIFTTRLLGVKSSLVPFSQASKDEGSLNSPHTVPLCCPDFDFYACNSLSICHIIRMYIVWLPLLNQQAVVSSSVCMFLPCI